MFPATRRQQPFRGNHPARFDPFNYQNQNIQQTNPFRRDFLAPQQPPRQGRPPGRRPSSGIDSLIRDENGKIDMVKIGNGVQNVMGVVNQAGPVMNMVKGLLR
ncbi:hypothetical protein GH741_00005 [Aquibacillus halophilus]|uniref:Uncharacterized protein n=1 Tax=Aquibacillus halophilus TaxID=930132 RepID=A0A6A8D5R8_9BACI|nr:YppG family protein [Aquibacillus halophilus]MRH41053.1 hypothetical protein [Aquibacillus halophilus]